MVEINKLNKKDDNMRSLLKLPIIDKDIRKLGVGGSSSKNQDLNNLDYLLPQNIDLGLENNAQIIDLLKYKANSGELSSSNEAFL